MQKRDMQRYRGYLPMKWWCDDTVKLLGRLIGGGWINGVFINKYTGRSVTQFRFGDANIVQIYMKDKTRIHVPLEVWYSLTTLDPDSLDEKTEEWIQKQKDAVKAQAAKMPVKRVKSSQKGGALDL